MNASLRRTAPYPYGRNFYLYSIETAMMGIVNGIVAASSAMVLQRR
jgi:hypothetical protein